MSDGPDRDADPFDGAGDDDHGLVNGEFTAVVFDEAFVRAALVHEPSATERTLATGTRTPIEYADVDEEDDPDGLPLELKPLPYADRHSARWQRVVARVMLVVIGIVAVLGAAAAVYRASGGSAPGTNRGPGPSAPSSSSSPAALAHS
ncbi:hypothetical protein [Streptacidiphilus sp. MAP5-3]|uniref:SCO2583/SCO2584 N-terminal domain-containing protein n=1 Tax=unclassified Streptacidiphilus TaxID=2643834 RepID=UPI003514AFA2